MKGIYYLFTCKWRNEMVKFFDCRDLVNLMRTDKRMYFLIRNSRVVIQHIVSCKSMENLRKIAELKEENK